MNFRVLPLLLICSLASSPESARSQDIPAQSKVHFVWMGGNDCPPCMAWRAKELPLLEKSPEFRTIKYTYVTKTIGSSVPPRFFLPDEVKDYKDILDGAGNGGPGSPQAALIVNGEVFDYFWGVRTAAEIESMIAAVRTGAPYPFRRCVKMFRWGRGCEVYKS